MTVELGLVGVGVAVIALLRAALARRRRLFLVRRLNGKA